MTEAITFDFAEPAADDPPACFPVVLRGDFALRDYQSDALTRLRDGWREFRRQLAVMATGTGKTILFAQITHEEVQAGGRVLILAHTDELLDQAADKLFRSTGLDAEKEKAEHRASLFASVVVGSIQTFSREIRLTSWPDNHFSLVIVDEAHRCLAASYQKVLRYFHFGAGSLADGWEFPAPGVEYSSNAKVLGVTATADRGDRRSLGEFFESCPVDYGLLQAVRDGYLVRPVVEQIPLEIDLRGVRTSRSANGSDFDATQLTQRITPFLREIARHIAVHALTRKTVCFLPGIETARLLSEALCDEGLDAKFVSGVCPDRAEKIAWFHQSGNGAAICNAMLLTEGWDCLDSQTDILTNEGWKSVDSVERAQHSLGVYSLNRKSGAMELTPIEGFGRRPVREGERMFSINSQHVDIRTTEGHQFFIRYRRAGELSQNYLQFTGRELAARRSAYALPVSAELAFPFGAPLTDDELCFVAWFMTDGGFERSAVVISQAKQYKNEIRTLLCRLGFDFRERIRTRKGYANGMPLHCFEIPKGNHSGKLARKGWARLGYWLNKSVAPLLHEMTRRQFAIFWSELLKGDGEQVHGMAGLLWCSKEQADAYTQMATLRGYAASCSPRVSKTGGVMYRVAVRDKQFITSDPADKRAAQVRLSEAQPGESVWCVKNRNGTLVTRRNGRIAIIGNCPDASCVCVLRPTKIRSLFTQCVGRATRTLPGIIDGLDTAGERLAAIAASDKPDMKILDFLWLSDNLSLVKPLDLVATRPEIRELMMADGGVGDLIEIEERAERDLLKALERAARENAGRKKRTIDPLRFAVSLHDADLASWEPETGWDRLPPTPNQLLILQNNGIDTEKVSTRGLASRLLARVFDRRKLGLCTPRQLNFLEKLGIDDAALVSFKDASAIIAAKKKEWEAKRAG